jgi:catechol 2,3-dioxygenase-like lactoylglutathione lyase family enzyme
MISKTRHTGIVVMNLSKSIFFYEKLGFKLDSRKIETGDYIDQLVGIKQTKLEWAKLKLPDNSLLELLQYHSHPLFNSNKLQESNRLGCSHIAFSVDNIETVINQIIINGGKSDRSFQVSPDGRVKVVYCYDLEGNILEIVEELK